MRASTRLFETGLERIGRIIAQQYGLRVVFQGSGAYTDGKTIYLPSTAELSDELMADMHGFLDHEVGHCRFTVMDELKKLMRGPGGRFQKELLNATEDVRIERLQVADFPGIRLNLDPLNAKLLGKLAEKWAELPWPVRLILNISESMKGAPERLDADTRPLFDAVRHLLPGLNAATSTSDMREVCEAITKALLKAMPDLPPEEGEGEERDGDGKGKGKGKGPKGATGKKGELGDGEGEGEKSDSEGSEGEGEGEGRGEPSTGRGRPGRAAKRGTDGGAGDGLMKEPATADESAWDATGADLTVDDMVSREVKEELGDTDERSAGRGAPGGRGTRTKTGTAGSRHLPVTTAFDREIDHTGKGDKAVYRALSQAVRPFVAPIKRALERHLKVMENRKWVGERERGKINVKALAKMTTNPEYRTPFKEARKTETNNVAVELLIDLSGSMNGSGKIECAQKVAIAVGEALKELKIPFEVTGFTSMCDDKVMAVSGSTSGRGGHWNRSRERLDTHIFKDFASNDLSGIAKVRAISENPDGEAVRWAVNRLTQQRQKRKVLFVLSDGSPATSDGDIGVLNQDLKDTVAKTMKAGIEVVGFGIMSDAVRHFYPDHVIVNKIEDLPGQVMTKLAAVIGGMKSKRR